jgi:large subunit ribosomal protein L13
MATYFPSGKQLAGNRNWYVIDAAGQTVGHLATEVASLLTGKRNPRWTPFLDLGDNVIVINARQAVFKGSKAQGKVYRHHTSYPGGLRQLSVTDMFARHPERVIELAVKGMLPKSKLGKAMAKKLKIYADGRHPHSAQRPQPYEFTSRSKNSQQNS